MSQIYSGHLLQPHWKLGRIPKLSMRDIDDHFRAQANVSWIAYGWRRTDSMTRALIMKQCNGYDTRGRRLFPLRAWRRGEVLEFLRARNIVPPPTLGRKEQSGFDFHPEAIRYLRDHCPDDWRLWVDAFPFSEARLYRDVKDTGHAASGHGGDEPLRGGEDPVPSTGIRPRRVCIPDAGSHLNRAEDDAGRKRGGIKTQC